MRVGPISVLSRAGSLYVTLVRNTPLLIIIIFFRFAGPKVGLTWNFVDLRIGDVRFNNIFTACVIGLSLYTAAFVCEALRSGVNAVPLGQAEAARAIGLPFTGVLREGVLPQALRASVPPLASVQIALLKNTTVCGVLGIFEAFARMKSLTNDNATARLEIFLAFALIFVVLVEDRMSSAVLFDAPGPATVRRHRLYTVATVVGLVAVLVYVLARLQAEGQFAYDKWEVLITPKYVQALLVDGLLNTLKMAFTSIIAARLRCLPLPGRPAGAGEVDIG
eukprot:gene34192-38647_t